MTLYEFTRLDQRSQSEAIFGQGIYLETRLEESYYVNLYAVDNFWVEVFYDSEGNDLNRWGPFRNPRRLNPYLKRIELPSFC
ncbi:MAG: hypothetical protein LH606_22885 [Cytophagaceae bacterium]|nr:hypothetical protein [Cytophagaceae bacterium]